MASVTGPSKSKAALPKKKNGFYVFMEERKLATEESLGFKLNMSDLSLVLSEDWKNMSVEEKEGYTSKAKAYNEKMRAGNEQTKLETPRALVAQKEAEQCKENREIVWNMITENSVRGDGALHVFAFMSDLEKTRKCLDWIFEAAGCSIPIKVLNLSLYAHLASTVNNLNFRSVNEGEGAASRPISSATLFTKMKNEDDAALEERAMKERHQRRQRRLLERQLREKSQREQVEKCRQWQEAQRRFTEEWRSQNEKRQEAKRLWPWATQ
ncbi:unnamed protein product [Orchesella dallaii]|uniref:HMG box domain-containing protein n=1 Tax=Orchesella dallaii TaxID=48710 RepID=A0ABP1QKC2_9HEXA